MVQTITVVLDRYCLVPLCHWHPLDIILLDEFKEGSVAKHLGDLKLVLVPTLRKARFHIALAHVKCLPVYLSAKLADEDTERDVKVGALVFATLDAVGVEVIFYEQLLEEVCLVWRLALDLRLFCWRLYKDQIRVVGQVHMWLLVGAWSPGCL